jgi:S1-C subfamily serine protease
MRPWSAFTVGFFAVSTLSFNASSSPIELSELAERTKPSVVLLTVEDDAGRKISTGTGFFVSPDGRVVTNHHVIDGAEKITATLSDGSKRAVLGRLADDEEKDIAILKVEGEGLPALQLGDSSRVKPGDEVVVIGSPMGLSGTLTVGIVSAIREHGVGEVVEREAEKTQSWGIQITAAISPGSSGSPIMTRSGEVIAVAVGGFNGAQALNFGIPIEVTRDMLARLGPQAKPTPFEDASRHDILRNLLISAGGLAGLMLLYFLWGLFEKRGRRRRRPAAH